MANRVGRGGGEWRREGKVVEAEHVESRIRLIRGKRVMLDRDLAELYGVTTTRLNEQVQRNLDRFPSDFMFQLTKDETICLSSQFAISKPGRGGRRYLPYAFTEHGAVMLASVLNSPVAVEVSVLVVRAFVKMRRVLAQYEEVTGRLDELESRVAKHDEAIRSLVVAIRGLIEGPGRKRKGRIGFLPADRSGS
jgi:hypothetical protein